MRAVPEVFLMAKTPEQKLAYMRQYRAARTPEQVEKTRAYQKAYRAAHPGLAKARYWKDPEAKRALAREWQKANTARSTSRKRAWREANLEKDRLRLRRQQLKRYGLTENDVSELLAKQRGVCAICKMASRLCVDHCHSTGRVRGLLCDRCNRRLGVVEAIERSGTLARTLEYLDLEVAPCTKCF